MQSMDNAIILHGMPSKDEFYKQSLLNMSNLHWIPWLQSQLIKRDIRTYTPDMPKAYEPNWEVWCSEVERYEIGPRTTLVGHSCGAGFWVRYLSEHPNTNVDTVVLVAPWLDPGNEHTGDFFRFNIDPNIMGRTRKFIVCHSDNDMGNVHKSVALLRTKIPNLEYHEFHNHGHFLYKDMKTHHFPELLSLIIGKK